MTGPGTPAAEVDIDLELVKPLIEEQHPQYASHRLRPIGSGWDNVMFRLGEDLLVRAPDLLAVWRAALAASPCTTRRWLHGDLHPLNVIVQQGRITGIIDWGDLTGGDPATDLAALWMLFDAPARAPALATYGVDSELNARAKGWAVLFGTVLLDTGLTDNPDHAAVGTTTLRRVTRGL